ncbi:MAG: primosomal protein N' [Gammaproteobacteria bacterium]|nr:primosomal protein N' [Gammaproteobacteria bacterium]
MTHSPVLQIAIPIPFRKVFEYLPANGDEKIAHLKPGIRVKVQFGRTTKIGIITGIISESTYPREKLKPIIEYLDDVPFFDEQHLNWLLWVSQYYHHPLGETLFTALPVALRKDKIPKADLIKNWQLITPVTSSATKNLSRAPKQLALFNWLKIADSPVSKHTLDEKFENWATPMKGLIEKKLVEITTAEPINSKAIYRHGSAPTLNDEQHNAVSKVNAAIHHFGAFLLDGVTGSGKTEVYLNIIEKVIEADQQVLFLLPEIGLTPQLLSRFKSRYGDSISTMHSGMNDTERYKVWNNVRQGNTQILIGTRSAIFTPFKSLGIIIIDEEHDLSFKQQDGLRYSARDIAITRASQLNIPIVLGSATPSLESLSNLRKPTFTHLILKQRAGNALKPRIGTIDLTNQKLDNNLSPQLLNQIKLTLARDEQVLLFLNRRGFAPAMICQDCGWCAVCSRCDRHMTIHHQRQRIICHHCGAERKLPAQCPQCSCIDLRPVGFGTERMEQLLIKLFPETEIIRIDRDTTSRKNAMHTLLAKIDNNKGQILLGTQMLAKGHDFPNVTFVGIIDADQGLFGADMRSAERMAQLITQVAGRAGRGDKPGKVAIQTLHPNHPLLQILINEGYPSFSQSALQERQAAQLPPYTFAAMIRTESTQLGFNFQFLNDIKMIFTEQNSSVELLGPAPSPMERKAGKFRTQLLLLSQSRSQLHQLLGNTLPLLEKLKSAKKVRWSLDVDPMEMS